MFYTIFKSRGKNKAIFRFETRTLGSSSSNVLSKWRVATFYLCYTFEIRLINVNKEEERARQFNVTDKCCFLML